MIQHDNQNPPDCFILFTKLLRDSGSIELWRVRERERKWEEWESREGEGEGGREGRRMEEDWRKRGIGRECSVLLHYILSLFLHLLLLPLLLIHLLLLHL